MIQRKYPHTADSSDTSHIYFKFVVLKQILFYVLDC